MNVVALIQARMGSTRLPGKSLLPIAGVPLVLRVIERVKSVTEVDTVVLATSDVAADDPLAERVIAAGEHVFRGNLHNVQKRFFDAAQQYKADLIIRVTGDNPLIDPGLIVGLIRAWENQPADCIACESCIPGVGSELFTMEAFTRAVARTATDYQKEHVTPIFYEMPEIFTVYRIPVGTYLGDTRFFVTVDTRDDYEKVNALYEKFYDNGNISNREIVEYLRTYMGE